MEAPTIAVTICIAILLYVLNFVYINNIRKKKEYLSAQIQKSLYTAADVQALSTNLPDNIYAVMIDAKGNIEHHTHNQHCLRLPVERLYQEGLGKVIMDKATMGGGFIEVPTNKQTKDILYSVRLDDGKTICLGNKS